MERVSDEKIEEALEWIFSQRFATPGIKSLMGCIYIALQELQERRQEEKQRQEVML